MHNVLRSLAEMPGLKLGNYEMVLLRKAEVPFVLRINTKSTNPSHQAGEAGKMEKAILISIVVASSVEVSPRVRPPQRTRRWRQRFNCQVC